MFKTELSKQNWNIVFMQADVDKAYNLFFKRFLNLYKEYCPMKNTKFKNKQENKAWITKALMNSCRKKNVSYKNLIT